MSAEADKGHEDFTPWVEELCEALGVDAGLVDVEAVLDMTKYAARNVARPAAPVSSYIAGLATAAGASRQGAVEILERVAALARTKAEE